MVVNSFVFLLALDELRTSILGERRYELGDRSRKLCSEASVEQKFRWTFVGVRQRCGSVVEHCDMRITPAFLRLFEKSFHCLDGPLSLSIRLREIW